jgi:tetratricopeptide (TPR) repeat protein
LEQLQNESQSVAQYQSILTQTFEARMGRRAVLLNLGRIEAARADTLALLPLAQQIEEDRTWFVDALLARADFPANAREDLRPCLRMAEEALDLARALGDRRRELFSLISVASLRLVLREANALEIALETLTLSRELGDLRTEVNILLGIGNAYGMDDLPRSREYLEAALARSESLKDKSIEIQLLEALGRQFERDGDYYRQLTEYELKRLQLCREIGNRYAEGQALMFCGQIQGLYLGDYEAGLEMQKQVQQIWEPITGRLFPLLRISQIHIACSRLEEAAAALESARALADKVVVEIGRAGYNLVTVMLYGALGDEPHLRQALELVTQLQQMTSDNLVSQQYRMAAACEASEVHLQLVRYLTARGEDAGGELAQALADSRAALDLYQRFGFVQIVECTSEEILYRHSQALSANGQTAAAEEYLARAYAEMLRKAELIPAESPFRKTFLENIPLHRIIQNAYLNRPS